MDPKRLARFLKMIVWAVGGAVVVSAFLVGGAVVTLPGCTSCHAGSTFDRESKAHSHYKIECVRCHVRADLGSRISYGAAEVFGMVLRVYSVDSRALAYVDDPTCLSCHASVGKGVSKAKGLRINHSLCAKNKKCTDCHSDTAHGTSVTWQRVTNMDMCLECHKTDVVRRSCETCHEDQTTDQLLALRGWDAIHGPNWESVHGAGNLENCTACHKPDYCVKCHKVVLPHPENWMHVHGAPATTSKVVCTVCHPKTFCTDCHGIEIPHSASFASVHTEIVKAEGQAVCLRCHEYADCEDCHVQHVHPGGATESPGAGR